MPMDVGSPVRVQNAKRRKLPARFRSLVPYGSGRNASAPAVGGSGLPVARDARIGPPVNEALNRVVEAEILAGPVSPETALKLWRELCSARARLWKYEQPRLRVRVPTKALKAVQARYRKGQEKLRRQARQAVQLAAREAWQVERDYLVTMLRRARTQDDVREARWSVERLYRTLNPPIRIDFLDAVGNTTL